MNARSDFMLKQCLTAIAICSFIQQATFAAPPTGTKSNSAQPSSSAAGATTSSTAATSSSVASTKSKDSSKVYSPDRKSFAFARSTDKIISTGSGDANAATILYGNTSDNKARIMFAAGAEINTRAPIGKVQIADIDSLQFSLDGHQLFFLVPAYATSGAAIALDLQTGKLRYIVDANSLQVVRTGKRKGYLLVTRHRYHTEKEGYGSYEQPEYVKP
jgi:hypothetical protein